MLQVKYLFTYLATVKDLNCSGRWGKIIEAFFKSVLCRLAENSIQKHVKKGRCPKTFFPGL